MDQLTSFNIKDVPESQLQRFDDLAESAGVSRSEAVRAFITHVATGALQLVAATNEPTKIVAKTAQNKKGGTQKQQTK